MWDVALQVLARWAAGSAVALVGFVIMAAGLSMVSRVDNAWDSLPKPASWGITLVGGSLAVLGVVGLLAAAGIAVGSIP